MSPTGDKTAPSAGPRFERKKRRQVAALQEAGPTAPRDLERGDAGKRLGVRGCYRLYTESDAAGTSPTRAASGFWSLGEATAELSAFRSVPLP
jgi:hypothetical protein